MPVVGQISTFGLACSGHFDTKVTTCVTIPQKLRVPFLPYKIMKQVIMKIIVRFETFFIF